MRSLEASDQRNTIKNNKINEHKGTKSPKKKKKKKNQIPLPALTL